MKRYRVTFNPEARDQLIAIEAYIASENTESVARNYVAAITKRCRALDIFPNRGTPRPDLGKRLRTLAFRRRVTIVYAVDDETADVSIVGIYYGGQDVEGRMRQKN